MTEEEQVKAHNAKGKTEQQLAALWKMKGENSSKGKAQKTRTSRFAFCTLCFAF
jgi:hypothetical protein